MKKSVHILLGVLTFVVALSASSPASAQEAPPASKATSDSGLYLTVFRSPATGIEYRRDRLSVYAGYYVTILKAAEQAKSESTNFIRVGATFYFRSAGWSPVVAPVAAVNNMLLPLWLIVFGVGLLKASGRHPGLRP